MTIRTRNHRNRTFRMWRRPRSILAILPPPVHQWRQVTCLDHQKHLARHVFLRRPPSRNLRVFPVQVPPNQIRYGDWMHQREEGRMTSHTSPTLHKHRMHQVVRVILMHRMRLVARIRQRHQLHGRWRRRSTQLLNRNTTPTPLNPTRQHLKSPTLEDVTHKRHIHPPLYASSLLSRIMVSSKYFPNYVDCLPRQILKNSLHSLFLGCWKIFTLFFTVYH